VAAVAALVALAACQGVPPAPAPAAGAAAAAPVPATAEAAASRSTPPAAAPQGPATQDPVPVPEPGPEILLPDAAASDDEVARVGDVVLRKSHAYTRLFTADPKLALTAVDLLVFDVLVARHAREFGIRLAAARVAELATAEEQQVRQQVRRELGTELDFAGYVRRIFGMRLEDWQQVTRLRTAQRLYQGYVIRFLAMREDRVVVRYVVHKDEQVARDVAEKVREGADFATLALRWSEDGYRRDGGLLPAFSRGFPHPVAETAFTLQKGQVSAPFKAKVGEDERWFVVYCLDRLPGRDVAFAQVRDEIDRDLALRPLAPIEMNAYTLRWRGLVEMAAKDH
jgi:hypothetical protein